MTRAVPGAPGPRSYLDFVSPRALQREYPIGPPFLDTVARLGRDEIRHRQDRRFRRLLRRAWQVPFYRRLWAARGLEPGDVRGLDDIGKLPVYGKADLMRSVEEHPPFGDYHGVDLLGPRAPVVFHTTSGTTGRPQPLFWGARSRELQNLLLARGYLLQGVTPHDVVQSVYGHGVVNGGHYIRETFLHFVGSLFISAGTGAETRSRTQVEYLRDFGVTVLVGFVDYLRHLAEVAREMGLVPGRDIRLRLVIGHLGGESREDLSRAWGGAEVFDWYGVGDTGLVAAEGPDHAGLYVMEDAHHVDVIDPESHAVLGDGATGALCVTTLFKDDVFPVVRFNTNDLSAVLPGASPAGLTLRRLAGFLGRSDSMVKLRGINVYPSAVAGLLRERPEATGEFLCTVTRREGRDEMTVAVEVRGAATSSLAENLLALLRARLGVEVGVELAAPGALAPRTGLEGRQKPIRLIDERFRT